jgi:hypothetical protein
LTLREKHRFRVSENSVRIKIFCPKSSELTGDWRKLYNMECQDLYTPHIFGMEKSRGIRLAGHEAGTERNRGAYRILVRNL